ncbi:MAG: solute carrier family 25 protein, partial [Myxococcaceae bacterium]
MSALQRKTIQNSHLSQISQKKRVITRTSSSPSFCLVQPSPSCHQKLKPRRYHQRSCIYCNLPYGYRRACALGRLQFIARQHTIQKYPVNHCAEFSDMASASATALGIGAVSSVDASSSSGAGTGAGAGAGALPLWHKLLVGASAGIVGTSLIYPLDILKTRLQSSPTRLSLTQCGALLRGGGFYRGFSACLVGIAPEKAIKLAANDALREHFQLSKGPGIALSVWEEVAAGSAAGFLQLFVTVPYEAVKIRLQMHTGPPLSPLVVLRATRNLRDLYGGFSATLLRDVPFCLLFFPLYAQLKALQMHTVR